MDLPVANYLRPLCAKLTETLQAHVEGERSDQIRDKAESATEIILREVRSRELAMPDQPERRILAYLDKTFTLGLGVFDDSAANAGAESQVYRKQPLCILSGFTIDNPVTDRDDFVSFVCESIRQFIAYAKLAGSGSSEAVQEKCQALSDTMAAEDQAFYGRIARAIADN